MGKKIKLFDPHIDKSEEIAVNKVLKSHFWASGSGVGNVEKFENKFRHYISSKSAIGVNNGTSALNLALSTIDLKNKEVILPSLSFVSTAHAVIQNGGIPKFVDVDPKTLCLDTDEIKKHISNKTKVILPVHFGGFPAELNKIKQLCRENNLHLVEDAAHAAGSSYKNKKIGSHGDLVCFSFHPVKNLAMPTGGLISVNTKNHKKIERDLKIKRWCGITNRKEVFYDVTTIGWNNYMNEFSAAIGLAQLKKLNYLNKIRIKIAKIYDKKINVENKMPFNKECSYHLFWIRVKNRNNFRKKMNLVNIATGIHYKPIHTFSAYRKNIHLPETEKIANEIVSIPIHPNLSDDDVERIVLAVNRFQ
mgnify:CR=1 FL=1